MYDVKGRHDLITWGWTKLGAHARSNTSILRLLECSFQVNMTLVCYLCLCSQHYIVVHVKLVDFLRLWRQLKQQLLGYSTTTHEISCHSAHQVPYLMPLESTTLVYHGTYSCCSQRFLCHRSSRNFMPFSPSGAVSDAIRIYYTGLPWNLQLL